MDDRPDVLAAFRAWANSEPDGNPYHPLIRFTAEEAFKAGVAWAEQNAKEENYHAGIEASLRG